MLTGAGAFRGDSVADTMASVLKLEPDFDKLPADTPPASGGVLRRCLQKDPDRRLHDIADARIEIEEADLDAPPDGTVSRRPRWRAVRTAQARSCRCWPPRAWDWSPVALLWSVRQ